MSNKARNSFDAIPELLEVETPIILSNHDLKRKDLFNILPRLRPLLCLLYRKYPENVGDLLAQRATNHSSGFESFAFTALHRLKEFIAANEQQFPDPDHVSDEYLEKYSNLFNAHEPKSWFSVLLVMLQYSGRERKLLPQVFRVHFIETLNKKSGNFKEKEIVDYLIKTISNLKTMDKESYHFLEDLIYILTLGTDDLMTTCDAIGPLLFAVDDISAMQSRPGMERFTVNDMLYISTTVLKFFVENYKLIFERVRIGDFEMEVLLKMLPDEVVVTEDSRILKLKEHLRHFYELRDTPLVNSVNRLFSYYSFLDIAEGLYFKYGLLPYGWKLDLEIEAAKASNQEKMRWFRLASQADINQELYLSEKNSEWPEDRRLDEFYGFSQDYVDKIIDELVKRQWDFLMLLRAFRDRYMVELASAANGDYGPEAKISLGLSSAEVKSHFRTYFSGVISAQEWLIWQLEPLILCRRGKILPEFEAEGRAGILFQTFIDCAPVLKDAFSRYHKFIKDKTLIIENRMLEIASGEATANVNLNASPRKNGSKAGGMFRSGSKRNIASTPGSPLPSHMNNVDSTMQTLGLGFDASEQTLGGNNVYLDMSTEPGLDFVELWSQIQLSRRELSGKSSLLFVYQLPAQESVRYTLFFDRILKFGSKECKPNEYPAAAKGELACLAAKGMNTSVNEDMAAYAKKRQEKLGIREDPK